MNAITLVIGAICVLAIAYRLYGIFFTKKVLKINDDTPTPAHKKMMVKIMCRRIGG